MMNRKKTKKMQKQNLKQKDNFYGFSVLDKNKCKQYEWSKDRVNLIQELGLWYQNVVGKGGGGVAHELIDGGTKVTTWKQPENKRIDFYEFFLWCKQKQI